jgi:hypothetical protein
MKHELPEYIIKNIITHVSKIIDHVEEKNSRVADAVRLTRKDLKKVEISRCETIRGSKLFHVVMNFNLASPSGYGC